MPQDDSQIQQGYGQQAQSLGIMDKFHMVKQGLDPGKPEDINKYLSSQAQSQQNMANGGIVQATSIQQPRQTQLAALQKIRGY